jgi:hypothetical protein
MGKLGGSLQVWQLVALIPIALGLSFVLSTGPHLQTYVLSLLNSQSSSIYGSAFDQELIEFPSLKTWLLMGLEPQFLLFGGILGWIGLRIARPRGIAWIVACAAFLALSAGDGVVGLITDQMSAKWISENLSSNFFGGGLIAAVVIFLYEAADFFRRHAPLEAEVARYVAPVTVSIGGLALSCFVYYASELFYNPLPAQIDLLISAPTSGSASPPERKADPSAVESKTTGAKELRSFSFAPEGTISANVSWISPRGMAKILGIVDGPGNPLRVSITPVVGCTSREQVAELLDARPEAWVADAGPTDFLTTHRKDQLLTVRTVIGKLTQFHLQEEPISKLLKITQFVGEDGAVELRGRELQFLLGLPLFGIDDKKLKFASRVIKLRLDGRLVTIRFSAPTINEVSTKGMACALLPGLPKLGSSVSVEATIGNTMGLVGFVVGVKGDADYNSMSLADVGVRLSTAGGWIEIASLEPSSIRHEWLGEIGSFQVRGNVSGMQIDDAPRTTGPAENYAAIGAFNARYGLHGEVRIWGQARWLWRDQARLNSTKWERLGTEIRLLVMGLVGTLLSALGALVVGRLRKNSAFTWY